MNQEDPSTWSSLFPNTDEDFSNLLELDGLDLDFSAFDSSNEQGNELKDPYGGGVGLDGGEPMYGVEATGTKMPPSDTSLSRGQGSAVQAPQRGYQQHGGNPHHTQNTIHSHGNVPPTPTSMELQGGVHGQFPVMDSQRAWNMHEVHLRKQQDQMVFTPLVSPAVTPLDGQFQMPEYAIPGEYFSPLSSPALQAQSQNVQRSLYTSTVLGSRKSETTSPVDALANQSMASATASPPVAKRSKKKYATATSKTTPRTVRESPSMKPQRKKQASGTTIPPKEIAGVIDNSRAADQHAHLPSRKENLALPLSQTTSESGSISPEYLSEMMPPPATPRPGSSRKSPYLGPEKASQSVTSQPANEPATPASLMKIAKPAVNKYGQTASTQNADPTMNDISLPPAAIESRPILRNIDTRGMKDQLTSTITTQAGGEMTPLVSSSTPVPPSPASSTGFGSKGDAKTLKQGKKRNSSSIPSPALRPRVSPSIKPLLPEGTSMNAETSALLLATKSNYQNILEGTHLPGVSYPEALSENLTSKRTSHKIAEQGRRNRINGALQEIAQLLPASSTPQLSGKEEGSTATAAQQSSSKASTVEMAIDYIKTLQAELKEVRGKLEAAETKIGELTGDGQKEGTPSGEKAV